MGIRVVIADDQTAAAEHRPDVLLRDIRMPKLDGLEATRRLSGRDIPRIVIVTTFDLDAYVHAGLHGGASGFLLKDASPAVLVEAVRAAAVGDSLVSPAITVRLLRDMAPRNPAVQARRRIGNGTSYGASRAGSPTPRSPPSPTPPCPRSRPLRPGHVRAGRRSRGSAPGSAPQTPEGLGRAPAAQGAPR